jgi:hypothetical protein
LAPLQSVPAAVAVSARWLRSHLREPKAHGQRGGELV